MICCSYCGSTLLQTEQDGDVTCLCCSRTLSMVPVGLPYVRPKDLRVGSGPRTSKGPKKEVAA